MPVTSPDNIWTPDSGDDYALTVDLARMADDIQDALNEVRLQARPPLALFGGPGADQVTSINSAFNVSNPILSTPDAAGYMTMVGGVLTCQKAGIYEIKWEVHLASTGATQGVRLIRNSAVTVGEEHNGPWTSSWNSYGSVEWVSLAAGDTLMVSPILGTATLVSSRTQRFGWKYLRPAV